MKFIVEFLWKSMPSLQKRWFFKIYFLAFYAQGWIDVVFHLFVVNYTAEIQFCLENISETLTNYHINWQS